MHSITLWNHHITSHPLHITFVSYKHNLTFRIIRNALTLVYSSHLLPHTLFQYRLAAVGSSMYFNVNAPDIVSTVDLTNNYRTIYVITFPYRTKTNLDTDLLLRNVFGVCSCGWKSFPARHSSPLWAWSNTAG